MKNFFKKRAVAWIVLALAIILSLGIGQLKNSGTSSYHGSGYSKWIKDDGNLLSASAEKIACSYNEKWDKEYHALVAVVTTKTASDTLEMDAHAMAKDMGLGTNDMLLVLEKGGEWYLDIDQKLLNRMTDAQEGKISSAMSNYFYTENYDKALEETFKVLDAFYAKNNHSGGRGIAGVVLFLIVIIAAWVIIDRLRYNRYRRRYLGSAYGGPSVAYYPIFWGRHSVPPVMPHGDNRSGGNHNTTSHQGGNSRGGFGGIHR